MDKCSFFVFAKSKYVAIYEFETDDIDEFIRNLYEFAADSRTKGRHVDCIAPAVPTSPVATFREIDPATLSPLEHTDYPTEMPEAVCVSLANN